MDSKELIKIEEFFHHAIQCILSKSENYDIEKITFKIDLTNLGTGYTNTVTIEESL